VVEVDDVVTHIASVLTAEIGCVKADWPRSDRGIWPRQLAWFGGLGRGLSAGVAVLVAPPAIDDSELEPAAAGFVGALVDEFVELSEFLGRDRLAIQNVRPLLRGDPA
jgi:hypothetical protein